MARWRCSAVNTLRGLPCLAGAHESQAGIDRLLQVRL